MHEKTGSLSLFVLVLLTGCPEVLTPPLNDTSSVEVSNLQTTYTNGTVMLFYEEPANPDFTGTELTFTPEAAGVTQPITVAKGDGVFSGDIHVIGSVDLINGTAYTFSLKAVYADGSKSTGLAATVTPSDIVAVPLNVGASVADGEVILSWDEPAVNNWAFVEIDFTPVVGVLPLAVSVGTTSISITGLANGTEYAFVLAATDLFGVYSTDVLISTTPSLSGDVTAPANVSGVSSTVTPKGEVYDVLQYLAYGGDNNPDWETEFIFEYVINKMNLIGNATNGICDIVWIDPVDADYTETELVLTRDSDSSSDTVTVVVGVETYQFSNIVLGESYTLSTRTKDNSNNWSASQDSFISSSYTNIAQFDLHFMANTPTKGYQYDYDYSVTDQLRINRFYYEATDGDGLYNDPAPGDNIGSTSYRYTYNSENRLISYTSFLDTAQSQIMIRYDFVYNPDWTLQSISANADMDGSGTIGDVAGENDWYIYSFVYTSGALSEIELNGVNDSSESVYHKYTLINNIDGNPTLVFLYFDAVNGTLDTNPSFKWNFIYNGNNRVSSVGRSNDTDLDGTFTYIGKSEYVYNIAGHIDSIPGYEMNDIQEIDMDFIY